MRNPIGRATLPGILAALALGFAAWTGASDSYAGSAVNANPSIMAFTEEHPGARIPVIIQAKDSVLDAVRDVAARGGADLSDLDIVGGVAATLTAEDVDRISRDPDVEFVALDATMVSSGRDDGFIDASKLATTYPFTTNAPSAWSAGATGEGVTVAVIDSGLAEGQNFHGRVAGRFEFGSATNGLSDQSGHGTYVSGIIAGKGEKYIGIAPGAEVLSLKVAGREGSALASDVISALQWAVDNKDAYNIQVINISLTSAAAGSYLQDPLDAAVEQAWFHGIVVVVAAGNFGGESFAVDHAPANDPYVITAGAFDDRGTANTPDDSFVSWSSTGTTVDGFAKPDVVAPGVGIVSTLAKGSLVARSFKDSVVDDHYVRMSGTSASSAIVTGVAALVLHQQPDLTPDEVKFRLMVTGTSVSGAPAPAVNAYSAVTSTAGGSANGSAHPSDLIDPETGEIMYDSVLWRSVLWRSVLWRSVLWRN